MNDLVCIGTSDAFGAGGRRQSAYLLRAGAGQVLLDCGMTTGTGLASMGLEREPIDVILVSHFHADHFGGIPLFLLACLYVDQRRRPLHIAGPPDVEARVRAAAAAVGHPFEHQPWSFPLEFQELRPGRECEIGPASVRAFSTRHSPESHPHGFRLRVGETGVAYSGDTGWFDELPAQVQGSDVFLCECTLETPSFEYHLSFEELVARRDDFDCGRHFLTHLGEKMRARADYAGFEVADDGLVIKL